MLMHGFPYCVFSYHFLSHGKPWRFHSSRDLSFLICFFELEDHPPKSAYSMLYSKGRYETVQPSTSLTPYALRNSKLLPIKSVKHSTTILNHWTSICLIILDNLGNPKLQPTIWGWFIPPIYCVFWDGLFNGFTTLLNPTEIICVDATSREADCQVVPRGGAQFAQLISSVSLAMARCRMEWEDGIMQLSWGFIDGFIDGIYRCWSRYAYICLFNAYIYIYIFIYMYIMDLTWDVMIYP